MGDGTNDVFVSCRVDTGPVTGSGMDAVKDVLDTTTSDNNSVLTACVASHGRNTPKSTCKPTMS